MKLNGIPLKNFIMNPFIIYVISWSIVIFTYLLRWSRLFPPLSGDLIAFFSITTTASLILGLAIQRSIIPISIKVVPDIKKIKLFVTASVAFVVVEFIIAGHVPLISAVLGHGSDYTEFGIPVVHVLLINFASFIYAYTYHCYLSCKGNKALRRKLLIYMAIILTIFLLVFNRGAIMSCVIISGIIYLTTTDNLSKSVFRFASIILAILFTFGLLGNLRTDTQQAKNVILSLGKATKEFKESPIPDPFFWAYIYIASPLSNLQYNVTHNKPASVEAQDVALFCLYGCTPQIISKRIAENFDLPSTNNKLITKNLNASTVYTSSFSILGWYGPVLLYAFTILFVLINILAVSKYSPYYVTHMSILCTIIFLNIFSNMFVFMGIVPQLIFTIIFSMRYRKDRNKIKTEIID